jgi:hypothetical protein
LFEPGSSLPGEYTYTVVDEAGCTASSTLLLNTLPSNDPFCIALALADLQGGGLQVHQDPARPTMALIIPPHSGTYLFTLFSTEGRLILEQRPALVAGEPFLLDLQQVNGNFFVLQTKDLADGRSWTTRLVLP